MRRLAVIATLFTLSLTVSSCGVADSFGDNEPGTTVVTVTAEKEAPKKEESTQEPKSQEPSKPTSSDTSDSTDAKKNSRSAWAQLAKAYGDVLDSPHNVVTNEVRDSHLAYGTFSYAIANVTGDERPEMLFKKDVQGYSPVSVFFPGPDSGSVRNTKEVILYGSSSAGGHHTSIATSKSENGLYEIGYHWRQPEMRSIKYLVQGGKIVRSHAEDYTKMDAPLSDHQAVAWFKSTDRSGLQQLAKGTLPSTSTNMTEIAPDPGPDEVSSDSEKGETANSGAGQAVQGYSGYVRAKSTTEVMKGRQTPNGESLSNIYYVLELDSPMELSGKKGGVGAFSEIRPEFKLGEKSKYADNSAQFAELVDKKVTVYVGEQGFSYPSDTSLPLGMPGPVSITKIEQ